MLDLDRNVSPAEFARMVGISQPAVSDMVNRGILPRNGSAQDWLLAYCQRMREQAAGRLAASPNALDPVAEGARFKKELADKTALENAVKRGELCKVADTRRAATTFGRALRDQLMAIPQRLAGDLAAETEARAVQQKLAEAIRWVLEDMFRQAACGVMMQTEEGTP